MRKVPLSLSFLVVASAVLLQLYRPGSRAQPELEDPDTKPTDAFAALQQKPAAGKTDTDSVVAPVNPIEVFTQKQDATAVKKQQTVFDYIFGDSIAEGMRMVSGKPGNTKVGRGPQGIYQAIKGFDAAKLKGKVILLTMGSGNNPSQFDEYGPQELQSLKDAGVAQVVVMGISNRHPKVDAAAMNKKIKKLAEQYGFIYGGEITNSSDKDHVHPANLNGYRAILQQAQNAYDASVKTLSVPPPAASDSLKFTP